jgi:glycine cleavage system aminomethyltransferase T
MRVKDPLSLGLQWMIDFDKETFSGCAAIRARREKGLSHKIIGIKTAASPAECAPGATIFDENTGIATVQASCYSPTLESCVGLALFPVDYAYAGLSFTLGNHVVETISMPPIMPKSLGVKLDEL